jgi:hypothetical protein
MREYDYRTTLVGRMEAETEREIDHLRQRVEHLERMLEHCLCHLSCMEARVAELERRPVAVPAPQAPSRDAVSCYRTVEEAVKSLGLLEQPGTVEKFEGELIIALGPTEPRRRA